MFSAALYAHARHFYHFAHETSGAARIRHSLRPLDFGGVRNLAKFGRNASRECKTVSSVIARSPCDEAIHPFVMPRYGLLRGACHRARIRATRWLAMTGKASAYW